MRTTMASAPPVISVPDAPDTDTDSDGTPDCNDAYTDDPALQTAPAAGGSSGGGCFIDAVN